MDYEFLKKMYDFSGQVVVVTGGTGVLLGSTVLALGKLGAKVILPDITMERAQAAVNDLKAKGVSEVYPYQFDVTDRKQVLAVADQVVAKFGKVDFLVNGAGGNKPQATTSPDLSFFDLSEEAVRQVFDLNFTSSFFCAQAFGRVMAEKGKGNILNIASMNAFRPLTRIPAYSAAKAALANFTQWLAVHMAQNYNPSIRVNAIAPGFLLTDQNRFLLTEKETGKLTARGESIISHTPMHRFGEPDEMVGAILWLLAPASSFVSGVVLPIDGGFSAFSGV